MRRILTWFLLWRSLLFIPIFVGILFLPFRSDAIFTKLTQYNELISPWANFDGVHYLAIASRWYIDEGRFLPLFPVSVGVVAAPLSLIWPILPFGPGTFVAGIIFSTICAILSLYFMAKLLYLDYKNKTVELAIFLFLAFPTAFFLACIYSEGMFLLLSVLSLYFARQKKWFLACILVMFLSITRLSGILIALPLLWEYYLVEIKPRKTSFSWKKHLNLVYFAFIPTLLLLYSYFNYLKWGDFLYFVNAHGNLGNSRETSTLALPVVIFYRYIRILLTVSPKIYEFWIALLEFGTLFYTLWSLLLSWKMKIRQSYQIFAWVMVALPLLSGTLTGFPRYILPIFPFFLVQAIWFEKQRKTKMGKIIFAVFVFCSILLQTVLLVLFSRGYFVA